MSTPAEHPDPESVASHRAPPGPVQRLGSRAGVGTLLVAALAVGGAIANWRPVNGGGSGERERPFVQVGQIGEPVSTRLFDAAVLEVRGTAKVVATGLPHDTAGVWLVLRIRLVARDEPTTIGYAALRDQRGREYRATTRFGQALVSAGRLLQPGVPVEAEVAFEVPRDAATRLSVRFAEQQIDRRMDEMAEIPLPPVDQATVDRWASDPKPVKLAAPRVVEP
ncbi:DUF4352 domain-containing protein [Plantactinospora endophytica]|uniref:DUF4352 domain-containing protein n=1 Tax=Plantactinospora endophytica TaxID=673535 RepID=A0ABQ4DW22_9ACTN|nr:hypothetical protein [Plantactinospora endophytica]GIG86650.1 hypothetical protein Pen02_15860 [Plantactinospora endophytica]